MIATVAKDRYTEPGLQALIKCQGKDKIRFILPLHPLERIGIISFTSSNTPVTYHECQIDESRYPLEDNYKIGLVSLKDGQRQNFYLSDFVHLLNEGVYFISERNTFKTETLLHPEVWQFC